MGSPTQEPTQLRLPLDETGRPTAAFETAQHHDSVGPTSVHRATGVASPAVRVRLGNRPDSPESGPLLDYLQ